MAVLPLVLHPVAFSSFFYFEDEVELIHRMDEAGFGPWVLGFFTESWVPVFKLLWGGIIHLSDGSYAALLAALWATHAVNTVLMAGLSVRLGVKPAPAVCGVVLFALPPAHVETLSWSVQWSAVLSITFLLAGLFAVVKAGPRLAGAPWRLPLLLGICAFLSGASFARGVLTGPVLALAVLGLAETSLRRRATCALAAMLPSVAIGLLLASQPNANHASPASVVLPALRYALQYFAESPLRVLVSNSTVDNPLPLALVKAGLYAAALAVTRGPGRAALAALVLFDVGNALLLGLGRQHTGLGTAGSYRYQYGALCTGAPVAAALLSWIVGLLRRPWVGTAVAGTLAAALAVVFLRGWTPMVNQWAPWRGGETRAILGAPDRAAAPPNLSRLGWMTNARYFELVDRYHLR